MFVLYCMKESTYGLSAGSGHGTCYLGTWGEAVVTLCPHHVLTLSRRTECILGTHE